eukprot:3630696-Rhodomonas_salina.1
MIPLSTFDLTSFAPALPRMLFTSAQSPLAASISHSSHGWVPDLVCEELKLRTRDKASDSGSARPALAACQCDLQYGSFPLHPAAPPRVHSIAPALSLSPTQPTAPTTSVLSQARKPHSTIRASRSQEHPTAPCTTVTTTVYPTPACRCSAPQLLRCYFLGTGSSLRWARPVTVAAKTCSRGPACLSSRARPKFGKL